MATQTIDFSNVGTVIKNGQYLTSIQLDGVTVWDSSHVGLLWQKVGEVITSGVAGKYSGLDVAIRDDGNYAAILHSDGDIHYYSYNGSFWALDDVSPGWDSDLFISRSNLNYVGDDLYFLQLMENQFNSNLRDTTLYVQRSGGSLTKTVSGVYNYMSVTSSGAAWITGNDRLSQRISVGSTSINAFDKSSDAPSSGNNPRIAYSSSLVVAYGNQAAIRGGINRAGEVQVYDGFGNQKGAFIVGESNSLELGKYMQISDDGNRIAVGTKYSVRVYDWDGAAWVQNVPDITCNYGGGRALYRLEASADLSRIACLFSNNYGNSDSSVVEVFEYNGVSIGIVGGSIASLPFDDNGHGVMDLSLTRDGNHLIVGNYRDDQSGQDAGAAVVYSLSAL